MKVFWSWQSDTVEKTGRYFVRDALVEAIKSLKSDPDIVEADRGALDALHIDEGGGGVKGSGALVNALLRKIDDAIVVFGDVTLIGETLTREVPRKLINANVALELGYAYKTLGEEGVFMVMNSHYGKPDDLPFDLRHRTNIVTFDLAPNAEPAAIKNARGQLVGRLRETLRLYIEDRKPEEKPLAFPEAPAGYCRAAYFSAGEPLTVAGITADEAVAYSHQTRQLGYVRLIPTVRRDKPIRLPDLREIVQSAPLLAPKAAYGGIPATNRYGAIRYDPRGNMPPAAPMASSTQLFPNGELWAVASQMIVESPEGWRPPNLPYPFLSAVRFESAFLQFRA